MNRANHFRQVLCIVGWLSVVVLLSCTGATSRKPMHSASMLHTAQPPGAAVIAGNQSEEARFHAYLTTHPNLTVEDVMATLPKRAYQATLDFDPSKARYHDEVTETLQLTDQVKNILHHRGFVSVDVHQHLSMTSAYAAIAAHHFPVLITTDSITHALHRSFNETIRALETGIFTSSLSLILASTHEQLVKESAGISDPALLESIRDVDLYLSVARTLLVRSTTTTGAVIKRDARDAADEMITRASNTRSRFGQDTLVDTIVGFVTAASADDGEWEYGYQTPPPLNDDRLPIYGGSRKVDWYIFQPRGHYAASAASQRYFHALTWLGRGELGWFLLPVNTATGLRIDADRERRNAAILSFVMGKSGQSVRFDALSRAMEFLALSVERNSNVSVDEMLALMPRIEINRLADLSNPKVTQRLERFVQEFGQRTKHIGVQLLTPDSTNGAKSTALAPFQVFAQQFVTDKRFAIDTFVLSHVINDSIAFGGQKQRRQTPMGLDVMAALGNDEAMRLLESELKKWNYGTNLLAARSIVNGYTSDQWNQSGYNVWLDALRSLDNDFPLGAAVPQLMRTQAWQHKQLQTQLASWAELRHDTTSKRGRDTMPGATLSSFSERSCMSPTGYVEPYPEFFARLGFLAQETARLVSMMEISDPEPETARAQTGVRKRLVDFWTNFARIMNKLQTVAQKEIDVQPFTDDELAFVQKPVETQDWSVSVTPMNGPTHYDGWYPKLIFGHLPARWEPTIASVHTNEVNVGTGDVMLLVAAMENQGGAMVHVGPMSSYYEVDHFDRGALVEDANWESNLYSPWGDLVPKWSAWTWSFHAQHPARDVPERGDLGVLR